MSLVVDASAIVALHFDDEAAPFADLEERLSQGEKAYTAPNLFQEVMESLRRAVRQGRTSDADANAFLTVLDSYDLEPVAINPLAGCSTWLLAETLNISAYDAGYVAVAKAKGLPLWTKDGPLTLKLKRDGIAFKP